MLVLAFNLQYKLQIAYKYKIAPQIKRKLLNKNKEQQNLEENKEPKTFQELLFLKACKAIKKVKDVPPEHQLDLYGLYKQQKEGNNNIKDFSKLDYIAKQKAEAWENCVGLSKEEAQAEYIALVAKLSQEFREQIASNTEYLEENDEEEDENEGPATTWGLAPSKMVQEEEYQNENLENLEELKENEQQIFDLIENDDLEQLKQINLTQKSFELRNEQGISILHSAIDQSKLNIVNYLLEQIQKLNVKIDIIDVEGQTPLHYAILIENDELIVKLLQMGSDPNVKDINQESPMDCANKQQKNLIGEHIQW
ncbi:Ankyrin repeat-containing domain [Pseudocohnilembus persalinus]|uniref:Ankyrin repeat-containing domain n=1 Tax=Pseudocohnilembus persalinus TaxID=266149 RepID=A0A0V0QVJ2_PSEPJ|nr:Ankyrin repeat-containing domain [Pseudocohnilembus persalinus]|eukprot:KRX06351.1 Ankyrin repeat-containing domain [Pseudocohnilembus persalinus]